jgi:hypothetical protein
MSTALEERIRHAIETGQSQIRTEQGLEVSLPDGTSVDQAKEATTFLRGQGYVFQVFGALEGDGRSLIIRKER